MTILITGFLGAGKSLLALRLREQLRGHEIVEAAGTVLPSKADAVVAVADAANLLACLDDPLLGPLVAAQIRAAGLVALSRTDIAAAQPALERLAALNDAPLVEVPAGPLPTGFAGQVARLARLDQPIAPAGTLVVEVPVGPLPPDPAAQQAALPPAPTGVHPAHVAFAEWRYSGPAGLSRRALDALLADRPRGLYRLAGVVRCDGRGVEVELAGRLRQTRDVPAPAETVLHAIGPRARFRPSDLALRFSEAAAARGWLDGLFGHR